MNAETHPTGAEQSPCVHGSAPTDPAAGRADSGEAQEGPRRRHKPIATLEAARKEMERTYRALKDGKLPDDRAKTRIYVLGKIVETIKAENAADGGQEDELAALLAQARRKLQ